MRIVVLWIALGAVISAMAQSKKAAKPHPQIDAGMECAACHDKVAAIWDKGRHGVAQVRCAACHGTPTAGFTAKPAATVCRSCHPAQFDSTAKNCVSCHPPHALSPHAAKGAH